MSNAFIPVVQFFRWNAASAIFIDQCDEVKNFEKPFARLGRTGKNGNKPAERKCMLHFLQYDLTVFPFKNVNFIQEQEKSFSFLKRHLRDPFILTVDIFRCIKNKNGNV